MVHRIIAATVGLLTAILVVAGLSLASGPILSQARLQVALADGFSSGALWQYDRWVECAHHTMQFVRHDSAVLNALETRWIRPGHHTCEELQVLVSGLQYLLELQEPTSYANYPAGPRHLHALLLSVLPMSATMRIYKVLSYASVLALFFAAWRNSPRLAVTIVAPVSFMLFFAFEQHRFANNTMWAPGFFVGFFALSAFLAMRRWFQSGAKRLGFFCFLGVIVSYFDCLHGPLPVVLSLTIVLDHFFYAAREKDVRWFAAVGNALTILACFLFAFGLLTVLRLELLSKFTSLPVWADFLTNLGTRLSNTTTENPSVRTTDIIAKLWSERREMSGRMTISTALLFAGAAAWIASAGLLLACRTSARVADGKAGPTAVGIFVLAMAGGGILAWYPLFPNHTVIHAWVMVRMLALPVAYGFSALLLVTALWRETRLPQSQSA